MFLEKERFMLNQIHIWVPIPKNPTEVEENLEVKIFQHITRIYVKRTQTKIVWIGVISSITSDMTFELKIYTRAWSSSWFLVIFFSSFVVWTYFFQLDNKNRLLLWSSTWCSPIIISQRASASPKQEPEMNRFRIQLHI